MDEQQYGIWKRYLDVTEVSSVEDYIDSVNLYLEEIAAFSNKNISWETLKMTLLIAQSSAEYWTDPNQPYKKVDNVIMVPGNDVAARGPGLGLIMDVLVFTAVINYTCYEECGVWPCIVSWTLCSGARKNFGNAVGIAIGASANGFMMPTP